MKIIYVFCGDDCIGDLFFNGNLKFIHGWHSNDANYRSEYMAPLFEKLGYEVIKLSDLQKVKKVYPEIYHYIEKQVSEMGMTMKDFGVK